MEEQAANPARFRVVVVDDESHVRTILREILATLNCEVVAEGNTGMEAVDLFRIHQPDLMILDINMQVLSGEEALMLLMPEFPHAVIVMLTSMTDVNSVDTCLDLGAANYIRKDTPLAEIRKLIQDTIELYYGGKESAPPNEPEVQPEENA